MNAALDCLMGLKSIPVTAAAKASRGYTIGDEREQRGHPDIDVDLLANAQHLVEFLHKVDNAKAHIQPYSVEGMRVCVFRYETFWLPFLKQHKADGQLSAPLDIAWAWFMHTIAPSRYAADLQRLLQLDPCELVSPGPLFDEHLQRTKELWSQSYPSVDFDPPGLSSSSAGHEADACREHFSAGKQRAEYDIIAAAQRQQVFLYQVNLPHWRSEWFLNRCVDRYRRFLRLRKEQPPEFLVPSFDIDLVWHAHMANHRMYVKQTWVLTQQPLLDHDDSVNDREAGGRLETSYLSTAKSWREIFSEEYGFPGGMWRGLFPNEIIANFAEEHGHSADTLLPSPPSELEHNQRSIQQKLVLHPALQIASTRPGCNCYSIGVQKEGQHFARVVIRTPADKAAPPACILALDTQERVCAMARIIPPGYLAERDSDVEGADVPLADRQGDEPYIGFVIERCWQGGASDWAIVQSSATTGNNFSPLIFRCEEGMYCKQATSANKQYRGRMKVEKNKKKGRSFAMSYDSVVRPPQDCSPKGDTAKIRKTKNRFGKLLAPFRKRTHVSTNGFLDDVDICFERQKPSSKSSLVTLDCGPDDLHCVLALYGALQLLCLAVTRDDLLS